MECGQTENGPIGKIKTLVTEWRYTTGKGWFKNPGYGLGFKIFGVLGAVGWVSAGAYAASDEIDNDIHELIVLRSQIVNNKQFKEFKPLDEAIFYAKIKSIMDKLNVPPLAQLNTIKTIVDELLKTGYE